MCDLCIQVIDEKLAEGMSKRFGSKVSSSVSDENDNQNTHEQQDVAPKPLPADRNNNRAVLTLGRYRCVHGFASCCRGEFELHRLMSGFFFCGVLGDRAEIKESEGNRYIRDNDL